MAIQVQCDACYFSFTVKDEFAGKRGKCPECGSSVQVPSGGGRSSRSSQSSTTTRRPSRSAASQSGGGSQTGLFVGIGAGVLVLLLVVGFVMFRMGRGEPQAAPATASNTPSSSVGTAPAAPTGSPSASIAPAPTLPTTPTVSTVGTAPTTPPATAATSTGSPAASTPTASTPTTVATAKPVTIGAGGGTSTAVPTESTAKPASSGSGGKEFASIPDLVAAVEPSVCRINVKGRDGESLGSGFVIDKEGTVVTNYHVIEEGSEATVTFPDDTTGKVLGFLVLEPKMDLAVLKVDVPADKLHPVTLATEDPRKGEDVIAIGAPLGLTFTMTEGKVSAVRKADEIHGKEVEGTWIQTSTPISPGNSGGPLFNRRGEVVAANTMSVAAEGAQNLNFGTSYSNIRTVLDKRKAGTLIAMKPSSAPRTASSSKGRGRPVVDETKTERGKKLLGEINEILIQDISISFDLGGRGEFTAYVRNMAEKAWKQADVEVSRNPEAPAFMLIIMQFKKGTGKATNSILEVRAIVYVQDKSGSQAQAVKVWDQTDEVGTASESALIKGDVPTRMRTKIMEFFGKIRSSHNQAKAEAKKEDKKDEKK